MILVQGDDEDSFWIAHVIKYNLKKKTVTVRFFVKRAGDSIWLENTQPHDVHLNSVIAIGFEGTCMGYLLYSLGRILALETRCCNSQIC